MLAGGDVGVTIIGAGWLMSTIVKVLALTGAAFVGLTIFTYMILLGDDDVFAYVFEYVFDDDNKDDDDVAVGGFKMLTKRVNAVVNGDMEYAEE